MRRNCGARSIAPRVYSHFARSDAPRPANSMLLQRSPKVLRILARGLLDSERASPGTRSRQPVTFARSAGACLARASEQRRKQSEHLRELEPVNFAGVLFRRNI
jgi:hypothetical protein